MGAALEIARKGAADADEAANNMKNYIAKIMSPETLKKAKKEFGLDLYKIITDAQKKGKNPFEASMEAIMKATKGDQKAIGELFSDMQVQNFLRPMIQNWDKYKEIKDKALKGGGTVDEDFAKVMATGKEQIDKIGGALQRLAIVGGGALAKAFGGKGGLAERIDAVTKWISANEELVGTIAKVAVGFFGARLAVLGTMYVFNIARGAWLAGAAVLTRLPAILGLVATGLRMAGTAVLWLGRALLLNPIGLAVTAIGLAALVIYKNWEPIKAFFTNLWAGVKQIFDSAVAWIMDKVSVVFNIIDKVKAGIKSVMGGAATVGEKVKGGQVQYDAMGNVTGFTSPDEEELPKPAAAGTTKAPVQVNDNSQTKIEITMPPGTTAKEVADEVDARMKRREAEKRGSRMYDGANQ
ncbi:Phage-related minor tail protein [compost metagenome]